MKVKILLVGLLLSVVWASSSQQLVDDEFKAMNKQQAKIAATRYKKLIAQAAGKVVPTKLIDDEFDKMNEQQAKIAATKLKQSLSQLHRSSEASASVIVAAPTVPVNTVVLGSSSAPSTKQAQESSDFSSGIPSLVYP